MEEKGINKMTGIWRELVHEAGDQLNGMFSVGYSSVRLGCAIATSRAVKSRDNIGMSY